MNRWVLLVVMILASGAARAVEEPGRQAMSFTYNRNQSGIAGVDRYVWQVLDLALQRTRGEYGDYRLDSVMSMPTDRRVYALAHGLEGVTVCLFTDNPDREKLLVPVRIPVDRGLLGYRVLLIPAEQQARFAAVSSLADLASVRFGLLPWWDDATVMRRAGFEVVPGDNYKGLFQMLAARRFDALSRGAREVLPEYDLLKSAMPDLVVERHLALHYPMPTYFWFRDDDAGRRRAARVKAGLQRMVADGTLKRLFDQEYGSALAQLDLAHRLILELPNPLLDGAEIPRDPEFWFRP